MTFILGVVTGIGVMVALGWHFSRLPRCRRCRALFPGTPTQTLLCPRCETEIHAEWVKLMGDETPLKQAPPRLH